MYKQEDTNCVFEVYHHNIIIHSIQDVREAYA